MEEKSIILIKLSSVWAAVGITSWAEGASAAAFFYTILLIFDWGWKKIKGRKS